MKLNLEEKNVKWGLTAFLVILCGILIFFAVYKMCIRDSFDTSDKLYFESLNIDDVMNVIKRERPYGVILQFGGQTSLNLAEKQMCIRDRR